MNRRPKHHSVADTVNPELVRPNRYRLQPQASDITVALSGLPHESKHYDFLPREQQILLSFRGNNHKGIRNSVIKRLQEDSFCSDALVLRRYPGEQFKVFSTNEAQDTVLYSTKGFPGIYEVLSKRLPLILDNNLDQWKALFYYKPKTLILIPINIYRVRPKRELVIECITVLAYKEEQLPKELMDEGVLHGIISFCNFTAPLLVNVQRFDDMQQEFRDISATFESFRNISKEIQEVSSCINTIGLECLTLFQATHAVVFLIVDEPFDAKLLKYCSFGGGKVQAGCPKRECHTLEELPQLTDFPAGWSSLNKRCLRVNNVTDLTSLCGPSEFIHSIGGCIVSNIMCFIIEDSSNDMALLIELSEKATGFTEDDELKAAMFSKRISTVLASSVMLDHRRRAVRRNDITNKVINNIKHVAVKKVRHLLDMKFEYSSAFRRKFLNYRFVVRRVDQSLLPSIMLYMFTELKFIHRWKMRRATLIRFILSIKQGYRDNPYHNWQHACNTAHFAFILLRQAELQKGKYLTDLEALAFFVSCICHDIDHRGINSRLMSVFNQLGDIPSSYTLYGQEEGLVQRQHLTVVLQILCTDDCNIVENMSDEEYREFIEVVQICITATDIGHYLNNRERYFESLKHFDRKSSSKRRDLMSLLMIVCDLSETVKPWDEYIITLKSIFSEFFTQGDEELKHGLTPIPTMDRRVAYIPLIEMKFINEVVRPAYAAILDILPKIEECIRKIDYFKELWLISTKIFEQFAQFSNPLDILDQPEMKEERLKDLTHLELQKHVYRIQHSVGGGDSAFSLPMSSSTVLNSSSMEFNSLSLHATDPAKSVASLGIQPKKKSCSCKNPFKCCCCKRNHHALEDASQLLRCNQEDAFMEEQSQIYDRKRRSFDQEDSGDVLPKSRATI